MITIVAIITLSIIAVLIIARLIVYGWRLINRKIDNVVQCRLQDYAYFCEKFNILTSDVENIRDSLNRANDSINSLTNKYDCEIYDIKGKLNDITVKIEHINGLLGNVDTRIENLTAQSKSWNNLKNLIEVHHNYLLRLLLTHCHAYNVENNTLYIKNPLWVYNEKEPEVIAG